MKLNPNAQKWVDALRSGKYKQGDSQLKIDYRSDDIRHCCLGVLCEVAIGEGIDFTFEPAASYLPDFITEWVGLKSNKANFRDRIEGENSEGGTLVAMNDRGATFNEIADFIEEHAEELGVSA